MDSGCHKLSENVWFVWSKTSYSGDKWRCHRSGQMDEQTTSKDRATQLLICEPLSFAKNQILYLIGHTILEIIFLLDILILLHFFIFENFDYFTMSDNLKMFYVLLLLTI